MFLKKMLLEDNHESNIEEINLKQKLTIKQAEAELIIHRKKQEEDEKRKKYENERRKCEAEALKMASEMKRKREKEDLRLQKELQLKRLRQEEAKKKLVQEKLVQYELQKRKDQEDVLKLEKLETLRKIMTKKDEMRKKDIYLKKECFNKQKDEYLQRSGRNSAISTCISPCIVDGQKLFENSNLQNTKSNIRNESCKGESICFEGKETLVNIPSLSSTPPPPVPSPPTIVPSFPTTIPYPPTIVSSSPPPVPSPPTQSITSCEENSLNQTDLILPVDILQYENIAKVSCSLNKDLTKNKDIEDNVECCIQDINPNFISSKSGFGLGWKDIKTGLVKNRSSNYLQTNKENKLQIENISKTIINKSSSWFKSKPKTPEPVLISFVKKSDNTLDAMNNKNSAINEMNFDSIKTSEEDNKWKVSCSAPWRRLGKDISRSSNNSPSVNLLSIEGWCDN